MTRIKASFAAVVAALLIALAPQALMARTGNSVTDSDNKETNESRLSRQVRSKLVRLPYYGVFDDLAFSIDGSRVTLHGQVVQASTRYDAERSVAKIEGVTQVVNRIQVLPLSGFDDSIRVNTYRAIQNSGGLFRYFMGTNPSLHIVVNHGHVTLTGVVSNKMDQRLAYMAARGVPGVFSVTNHLKVEGDSRAR